MTRKKHGIRARVSSYGPPPWILLHQCSMAIIDSIKKALQKDILKNEVKRISFLHQPQAQSTTCMHSMPPCTNQDRLFFFLPLFAFCSWWISFGIRSLSSLFILSFVPKETKLTYPSTNVLLSGGLGCAGSDNFLIYSFSEVRRMTKGKRCLRSMLLPLCNSCLMSSASARTLELLFVLLERLSLSTTTEESRNPPGGDDLSEIRDVEILKKRLQHKIRHRTHSHTNNNNKNFKCSL